MCNDQLLYVSSQTEPNVVSVLLPGEKVTIESIRSGELLASADGAKIFTASSNIVQKYDIRSGFAIQEAWSAPFGFQAKINHFVMGPKGEQAFLCYTDPIDPARVRDVVAFRTANLAYAGKYQLTSSGQAVAVSADGKRIYIAPTDEEQAGAFIVEFNADTKIEAEYYMLAGAIKARGLTIDHENRYLYAIVNTPLDDDSFEPYNNNSYDLQRIAIH